MFDIIYDITLMLTGNMNPVICLQEREMIYILWYAIYSMHLVCYNLISKYILESMISVTLVSLQMIKHSS